MLAIGIGQNIKVFAAEVQGDLTVFGITLGKSLISSGMKECKIDESKKFYTTTAKYYDINDSDCYQYQTYSTSSCEISIRKKFSFGMSIHVYSTNSCDLESPIEKIEAEFGTKDYEKVLSLVVGKFDKPPKTENSVVQTKVGVKYNKMQHIWKINGHTIYLTNMYDTINAGALLITHSDKLKREAVKSKKKSISDQKNF
jgi:hypothetical protein